MKTNRLLVQETVDDIIRKFQRELNRKKDSVIADLNSKEESLIANLKRNPKIWNSQSLEFNLRTDDARDFSSAVNLDVTLNQVCFKSPSNRQKYFFLSAVGCFKTNRSRSKVRRTVTTIRTY